MFSTFKLFQMMAAHHVGNARSPVIEITCYQQWDVDGNLPLDVVL